MKQIALVYFVVFGMSTSHLFAQKNDSLSLKTTDTIDTRKIDPLRPARAAFYSAVLPGLGQAYNKKYWKIPIVYGAMGTSMYFYLWNQDKYKGFRDEYKKRLNGTADPNDAYYGKLSNDVLIRGQKFHQRNRDLSMLLTVGFYLLNIVEANVDAHLFQFNVDDNLSIKPDVYQNDFTQKSNFGLCMSYKF